MKGKFCKIVEKDGKMIITPKDDKHKDLVYDSLIPLDYTEEQINKMVKDYDIAINILKQKNKGRTIL